MILISSTDEFVVGSIHEIPDSFDLTGCIVDKFLRSNTGIFCLQFDFLAMLIGSGLEEHIITLKSLIAGNTVCQNELIGVGNVRCSGCIGNGCCHIKFFLFHLLTSVNSCFYQSSTGGKRSQLSGAFFQQRGLPEKKTVAHLNGLKFIDGRVDQIRVNNVLKIGVGAVECGFCPGNIFQKLLLSGILYGSGILYFPCCHPSCKVELLLPV